MSYGRKSNRCVVLQFAAPSMSLALPVKEPANKYWSG